jgi:hypothetical protein
MAKATHKQAKAAAVARKRHCRRSRGRPSPSKSYGRAGPRIPTGAEGNTANLTKLRNYHEKNANGAADRKTRSFRR